MRGFIKKRGEKSYSVVLYLGKDPDTGKKQYKWHTIEGNKKKAEKELTRLLNDLNRGTYVDPTDLTVGAFLTEHWLPHAKTQVASKTYERYASVVKHHLVPALGRYQLVRLHPIHIQAHYQQALEAGRKDGHEGGLSAQTVLHHHRVLHKALRMAIRWRMIANNPADAVEPPKPQPKEIRPIDETDAAWLIDAARGTRLYIPLLFALCMGMRRSEILAAQWQDMNLNAGYMSIQRAVEETKEGGVRFKAPKSRHGRRPLSMPELLVDALRELRTEQERRRRLLTTDYQDNDLVCCDDFGRLWKPSAFTSAYRDLLRRRNIPPIRFHDLRHGHASMLLRSGINPKVISERLGHSRVAFTLDTYAHLLPGMQEEAAKKTDANLRAALEQQNRPSA